jgi:hypothetical protein
MADEFRWLFQEPSMVTWTTDQEYRLTASFGGSQIHLASATEREHVLWAIELLRQQPPPLVHNMFDMMRARIAAQGREDTFSGSVRLTASQRSYVASALVEAYIGGAVTGPGVNRGKWHADLCEALIGPLRLER